MNRILFVTGTDTGVGKTFLTVALLVSLRRRGVCALAMKPFCSGGWGDVDLIQQVQGEVPIRAELTPYYFPEPLAPLLAARRQGRRIDLAAVTKAISRMAARCDRLIVEGAGGVLVPVGEKWAVADLIAELDCDVVLVAPNKLGVISHTRLAVESLRARGVTRIVVVLMEQPRQDLSARTNAMLLRELLPECPVMSFPFLRLTSAGSSTVNANPAHPAHLLAALESNSKKVEKVLAWIGEPDSFCARSLMAARRSAKTTRLRTTRRKRKKRSLTVERAGSKTAGRNQK